MRALLATLAGGLAMLAGTGGAAAATTTSTSSNWAGYAIHNARFKTITGTWKVPKVTCEAGEATYSAAWVGIGGYDTNSQALEQTGTEADCSAGQAKTSAWMEIVPAAAKTVSLKVSPGDTITGTVTVVGHRVTLSLKDRTTGRSFTRTTTASTVDTSSAEWIVEAPSECVSSTQCETLPLSEFSQTTFTGAKATGVAGHTGTISDSHWQTTKITLVTSSSPEFVTGGSAGRVTGAAATALNASGSSFAVNYASVASTAPTVPTVALHVSRESLR